MSNETKREAFVNLAKQVKEDAILDSERMETSDEVENDYKENINNYDAALPDDLPVIPKVWGDEMEKFKANRYWLSELFLEWDWHYDEQELIARAWVLGVWRVEETGEIVKLEAKK